MPGFGVNFYIASLRPLQRTVLTNKLIKLVELPIDLYSTKLFLFD